MSKVNKRKHVMKEMQTDDFDPPESNQLIVRILSSRGNNLHEVESAEPIATEDDGDNESAYRFLVTMPTKFRKNVWVKRGDFVIVEPIDEGDKVKAEIVRILTPQHIKEFTKMGIWPEKFSTKSSNEPRYPSNYATEPSDSTYVNDDDDDDLFVNTNRAHYEVESGDESQDSSDSDADDESEGDSNDAEPGRHIYIFETNHLMDIFLDRKYLTHIFID